ncbi:type II toxin-antitoxin system RelB/DinJ family antitoxin [Actinomycetaceae bacterium MB13-C1-2]|nr:type II toxin-antitoxin system RelB/DinJ family antitoxin [Actinomycetaceae bacterium MB13-C1-2]
MSSITIRVDEQTKAEANRIASDFGFDLSSVTRAFYRQMIRENRIPLNLSYEEPNARSVESLEEAKVILAAGRSRFGESEELLEALGIRDT